MMGSIKVLLFSAAIIGLTPLKVIHAKAGKAGNLQQMVVWLCYERCGTPEPRLSQNVMVRHTSFDWARVKARKCEKLETSVP